MGLKNTTRLLFSVKGTMMSQRRPRLTVSLGCQFDVVLNVRCDVHVAET